MLEFFSVEQQDKRVIDARHKFARKRYFDKLVAKRYEIGKASEAAAHLEIDAVIDPADTREVILKTINSAPISNRSHSQRRNFVVNKAA
jgi:acetyl-CoA carboxylase carboxyltransferase component